jgi:eukaryotic-like serine/threonine-protein kinase
LAPSIGTRIGNYEVAALIGAGGMGEVYRAKDTKLGREVALKILPATFTNDSERLARFRREAQVLASLNHPHIAQIYGLDEVQGTQFLVLELVDGESLDKRIARGKIPIDEALGIAKQIAEALEAAHEKGVIHRDLKPANIALTSDGNVKVLDFGLAKAIETPGSSDAMNSPTITTPAMMTGVGMILGTAAYMSPEQTKGKPADKRSDVWAFGCTLFEMLTGTRAFEGEDVSDTLANVLKAEPKWEALPRDLPPTIMPLIRGCLAKGRSDRISDIAVARFLLMAPSQALSGAPVQMLRPASRRRTGVAVLTTAAVILGLIVLASRLQPSPSAPLVARFSIRFPEGQQLAPMTRHYIGLSPDGRQLAFISGGQLFVRRIDAFDAHVIAGTSAEQLLSGPVFSPDGQSIAYFSGAETAIKRVPLAGGASLTVCSVPNPFGMSWDAQGLLIGLANRGIVRCAANGGSPQPVLSVGAGEQAHGPQLLPDGDNVLFTLAKITNGPTRWDRAQIVVQSLKSGARTVVVDGGTDARYLPTGHIVYSSGGILFAAPFDVARRRQTGAAVPVIEGVRRPIAANTGAVQVAISPDGTLCYVPGPIATMNMERALAIADRAGTVTRLSLRPGPYVHVRASPDGHDLAIGTDDGKEAAVWIQHLPASTAMQRLTFSGHNRFPIWSPDGKQVAYQSDRDGDTAIYVQAADGSAPAQRVTKAGANESHVAESWSPDGRTIAFSTLKDDRFTLWVVTLADKKTSRFDDVASHEPIGATFSPDGRWVAYASSTDAALFTGGLSGNRGIYLQPVPPTSARYELPRQRLDFAPVWTRDGKELVYVPSAASGDMVAVPVNTTTGVAFGAPVTFPARVTGGRLSGETRAYDILRDGTLVGLVDPADQKTAADTSAAANEMRVVLNWFEELKTRVPVK